MKAGFLKIKLTAPVLLVAGILKWLVLPMNRDAFVIRYGIRMYRNVDSVLTAVAWIAAALFVLSVVFCLRDKKKKQPVQQPQLQQEPVVSEMDECIGIIRTAMDGDWKAYRVGLAELTEQLRDMERYQRLLSDLIRKHKADVLADTESIFGKVKDHMLRNTRRLLTYLDIADVDSEADRNAAGTQIRECTQDNTQRLQQTKDFLYALNNFLNRPEDDTGMDMLEIYKSTILESLKEGTEGEEK